MMKKKTYYRNRSHYIQEEITATMAGIGQDIGHHVGNAVKTVGKYAGEVWKPNPSSVVKNAASGIAVTGIEAGAEHGIKALGGKVPGLLKTSPLGAAATVFGRVSGLTNPKEAW